MRKWNGVFLLGYNKTKDLLFAGLLKFLARWGGIDYVFFSFRHLLGEVPYC